VTLTPERSMSNATIGQFMTAQPHCIGAGQPLAAAKELMVAHGIRHLPVREGGRLVGILSERDVQYLESFAAMDLKETTVEEAMTPDPYAVGPDELLADVADRMARLKCGSAIVVHGVDVQGIFTTVDALKALAKLA
jgi:acetoin utilization protein AcuB